jgi:hypothetical protein
VLEGGVFVRGKAYCVIAIVVLGQLTAVALQRELWPFSHYPMYSGLQADWTFESHRLYGVLEGGEEIPLETGSYFEPYEAYSISEVLAKAAPDREKLERELDSFLSWYENREAAHGGPKLRSLRAYRVRYSLSKELDPRKRLRSPVLSRTVIAETVR